MAEPTEGNTGLIRSMPVMLALLDSEGRFLDVTDECVRRMGYTREELRGRRPDDIATPPSARRIREELLPHFRRIGRLDHVPVEFFTKGGQVLGLLATTVGVHGPDGASLRYSVSLFEEPSDRERLERRYLDLYESTPAMLHTIDPDGRITAVSNHWLRKLGYQRKEVIGRSILEFLSEESRRPLMDERLRDLCLARFGSPATACVDQAEDLSPQSSPFRDAWIGKNVRNKRVSDRVLFPSPAPLQLSRAFQGRPWSVASHCHYSTFSESSIQ